MSAPALLEAGHALAHLLAEENRLLAANDLAAAGALNGSKQQAVARFEAAQKKMADAAPAAPVGAEGHALQALGARLGELAASNHHMLARAITAQACLIDCIAAAARPAGPGYAAPPARARPTAFALNAKA